ncbi:MAG: hypothetical protein ABIO24_08020, partial [Saprospiraceae bacterium]
KQVTFTAQSNRWTLGAQETLPFLLTDSLFQASNCCFDPPFVQFFARKMLILDNAHWLHDQEIPAFPVDLILLSKNPKVSIADCIRRFPCRLIVSDGTNSWKQCDRWRTECANLGLSYHDIRLDGAYVWSN